MVGDSAAVLFLEAEKVCDFVTRVITAFHKSANDVVSNARFTNGEVKRSHTSTLLNGGNPVANHDALQTPARRSEEYLRH